MKKTTVPKNYAEELDEVDYQILELLRKNARMSAKEIAQKVFLSSTSVASRIEHLVQKGMPLGIIRRRLSMWKWSLSRKRNSTPIWRNART